MPPSGTNRKSPGRASIQSLPSYNLIAPEITKNDSEMDRWKWGSGPLFAGDMFQRYRPNWPLVESPVARYLAVPPFL